MRLQRLDDLFKTVWGIRRGKTATELNSRFKRALIAALVGVATTAMHGLGYLAFFDAKFDEARFDLVRSDPSTQLAIVAIDARSLNDRPVWPWPRSWHAQVVDRLIEAGAAQLVLDIDFSAASTPMEDAALAKALERAGNRAILPVFRQQAQTQSDTFIESFPLASFAEHTRIASANIQADEDGIVRRMSRLEAWGGALVPSLAAAAAGEAKSGPNEFLIDYGIRLDHIPVISYIDILDGRIPPAMLAGKIVIVGATALELGDVAATPANGPTPGVAVQALATSSLLQGRALQKAATWLIMTLTIVLFFAVEGQCQRRHWLIAMGIGAAWGLGAFGFSIVIQAALPVMIDVAPLVLSVVAALFASLIGRVRDLDLTVIGQSIALRRSSSLMRRVVENTFDGLVTLDCDGSIKSVNPAAERIIGRTSAELVARSFATLIPSLSQEKTAAWLSYLAEERQPQEVSLVGRDGQTVVTEIAVTRLPDEPSVAFVAVLRDITERKTAMAAAARNLNRLKDAIDSVASGFALFDADERLVMCNQNFRNLYPMAEHSLVPGWRAEDLIHAVTAGANPHARGQELARLTAERLHQFRNPGQPFEVSIGGRWVLIDERRTSEGGIVGVYTDITLARRQEVELRTAHDQAQAANRSKSQFLANMSHELRTPLNAVIGFSEIMKTELMGPLGTDVYRGYVKDIQDSASHLLSIINDILDLSSIEAGAPRLRESSFLPAEICRSVETLMSGRLQEAGITMTVSIRGLTGGLWADARLLKQMLINLISNAIKFSAANTRILLSVTQGDDQRVLFSVIDQGIGIAPNDLDRILRPFEQVANALTRNHEGVGLGLSLVKSMIEAHGGTLEITSVQGKGTTATIAFPRERLQAHASSARPSTPMSRAANDHF